MCEHASGLAFLRELSARYLAIELAEQAERESRILVAKGTLDA